MARTIRVKRPNKVAALVAYGIAPADDKPERYGRELIIFFPAVPPVEQAIALYDRKELTGNTAIFAEAKTEVMRMLDGAPLDVSRLQQLASAA